MAGGGPRTGAAPLAPPAPPGGAAWGRLPAQRAVVECAAASGLWRLRPDELDPLVATTYGTGELVLAALTAGCRELIVGLGGSATNDGGAGPAQALGLPPPGPEGD